MMAGTTKGSAHDRIASPSTVTSIHALPMELHSRIIHEVLHDSLGASNHSLGASNRTFRALRQVCRTWRQLVEQIPSAGPAYTIKEGRPAGSQIEEFKTFAKYSIRPLYQLYIEQGALRDEDLAGIAAIVPWSSLRVLEVYDSIASLSKQICMCQALHNLHILIGEQAFHVHPGSPITTYTIEEIELILSPDIRNIAQIEKGAAFLLLVRAKRIQFRSQFAMPLRLFDDSHKFDSLLHRVMQWQNWDDISVRSELAACEDDIREVIIFIKRHQHSVLAYVSAFAHSFLTQKVPSLLQCNITLLELMDIPQEDAPFTTQQWPYLRKLSIQVFRRTAYLEDIVDFLDRFFRSPPANLETVDFELLDLKGYKSSGSLEHVRDEIRAIYSGSMRPGSESYFY